MIIEADLTWTGARFEGVQIEVEAGRIKRIGALGTATHRLRNQALIPGFVNAHSHAFQRGLRGKGERFPAGSGSFWSWREAMYGLVGQIDEQQFLAVCTQAFSEMRRSGITAVGEFHYLHHSAAASSGGDHDYAYDALVLEAAHAAGIRIVLLNTYYRTGGIGVDPAPPQRRFLSSSPDRYWKQMERLERLLDDTSSLGAVAHSIRAATPDEIAELHAEAQRRGIVFHMHVEEQPKEIDDCVAAYGARPMEILLERLALDHNFTSVHSTHTTPQHLALFFNTGANVCITPLTEANLGDGIPDAGTLAQNAHQIALGSDSNNRISFFEEMRWLEYAQRLAKIERGIFRDADGASATVLFQTATRGGARSLGVDAGHVAEGALADFAAIDLSSPSLRFVAPDQLLDALVFGCSEEVVLSTCVGGTWQEHREASA